MNTNGHAGYGFKLRGPKGRRTKVPDPKEQQVIRWIAEQRQAGSTWEAIYFDLLSRDERTRAGKERVSQSASRLNWFLARSKRPTRN
jgi:hypothetical protein